MKKLYVCALSLAMCLLCVRDAHASSVADFTLVNDTGRVIESIRFKAHRAPFWGNNVLFEALLLPGVVTPIEFYAPPSCNMDIQIRYLDGSSDEYVKGQNLCATTAIRFKYGRSTSW
jgi:hypothetical protein